jgi:hypothetical protein
MTSQWCVMAAIGKGSTVLAYRGNECYVGDRDGVICIEQRDLVRGARSGFTSRSSCRGKK